MAVKPGIRFRISIILLLGALNLVALGTLLALAIPGLTVDLRPEHREAWEASRRAESLHAQMMVDAQRALGSHERIAFPEVEFRDLTRDARRLLEGDFGAVQQDLNYFQEAARRWYGHQLPVPVEYRGGFTVEDVQYNATAFGEPEDGDSYRVMQAAYLQLQDRLAEVVSDKLEQGPRRAGTLTGAMLVWISIMAAVTIYMAWRLRAVLSDPLIEVTRAAVAIGEGNLQAHVRIPAGDDELGALGRSIETMRVNLRQQFMLVQNQNQRMETIFGAMSDGVLLVDREWTLVQCNQAAVRLLGLSGDPAALAGRDIRSMDLPALSEPLDLELTRSPTLEFPVRRGTDGSQHVRVLRRKLVGPAGASEGFVAVVQDITHEKEMEQVKNDFFSMVTHELKTPLTAIEGYTKLLMRGRPGPINDEQRRFLETVSSQTDVLKGMIQDLLDMSRIAAGRFTLAADSVDVRALVRRVVERFEPQATSKDLELRLSEPPVGGGDELTLDADGGRLEQVLGNLVTNALKFTPAGGHITVTWCEAGGQLRLTVADTGRGIPRESLCRVFDKFYQVDSGDTRSVGGAGLGLFICREIVAAHGGGISASSNVGRGSIFTIEIPLAARQGTHGDE